VETVAQRGAEVWGRQQDVIFDALRPFYEEPLVLVEGQGVFVTDAEGREYLDFFAGILTTSLGHCHPRIVEAVRNQAGRLGHTSTLYVTEPQVDAAERLVAMAPGELNRVFFTNSGTEAIETALSLARMHTGRTEIVALRHAYHGRTDVARSLTAHASWRGLPSLVAGVTHTVAPYPYRAAIGAASDEELVDYYARDLIEAIETTTNGQPAALIAETIQGVGGFIVPPRGYFQRMAEIIRSYGGLFISDEVQAGFGRTGDHWFGIEHWQTVPDIMVMAKGIAGGLPVGATVTRADLSSSWRGKTLSTFGGNPICMAGMAAALDVMVEEDVRARARERGEQLRDGLERLASRFRWIGQVRGMGLMQGMELVEDRDTKEPGARVMKALLHATREEGLLIGAGGLNGHVVRLGPSLLISEDEVAEGLTRLERACGTVEESRS